LSAIFAHKIFVPEYDPFEGVDPEFAFIVGGSIQVEDTVGCYNCKLEGPSFLNHRFI